MFSIINLRVFKAKDHHRHLTLLQQYEFALIYQRQTVSVITPQDSGQDFAHRTLLGNSQSVPAETSKQAGYRLFSNLHFGQKCPRSFVFPQN